MRAFHIIGERFFELPAGTMDLPAQGFLWLAFARPDFEALLVPLQARLMEWQVGSLVDLHAADLLNSQLTSHFDTTSWYDLMVFQRLSLGEGGIPLPAADHTGLSSAATARKALSTIDTSPVGLAVFDRLLISVHPPDCAVCEFFVARMSGLVAGSDVRGASRLPSSPADLMLRMVNHMVDSYLDLRRQLSKLLARLQQELLDPRSHFNDWTFFLEARGALNQLQDICEDQRSAVQEWIDALDEWPHESDATKRRERELLRVRSRDVLEHIERVLGHVRRLEQSAESAVQMHFSALSHRTNNIMRTLTVLTAVFLPLNLITGFFGMNFDALPLIHSDTGIWLILGAMVAVAFVLMFFFWNKRYLGR